MMKFSPLSSGSSGNATYIEADGVRLLVDAGLTCKRITELLDMIGVEPGQLTAVLLTHEHIDHIRGVSVLSKKHDIPVYANAACWSAMREHGMAEGVSPRNMRVFETDRDFYLDGVRVYPFSTSHDAAHPVGYTISAGGRKCAVCTDLGRVDERILGILAGADILLLEANHDVDMLMAGSYPHMLKKRILSGQGHLCNEDCAKALVKLYASGVRNAVLGHLSDENNYPQLAYATVTSILEDAGLLDEVRVAVAERSMPTGVFVMA